MTTKFLGSFLAFASLSAAAVRSDMLVSSDWLTQHLTDSKLVILHVSANRAVYDAGHIPGARFVALSELVVNRDGIPNEVPAIADLKKVLEAAGVSDDSRVIIYGDTSVLPATRAYFTLDYLGHGDQAALLDGGLAKWRKENRPVTTDVPHFAATTYAGKRRAAMAVDVNYVASNLGKAVLIDARSPQRYRGESEPIDPVAGRIPGALNRNNGDNLSAAGVFKQPDELKKDFLAILGSRPASDVVNYCGSGVSAAHNALAMEVAGLPGSRLYAGSWSEWIADPGRPREKG